MKILFNAEGVAQGTALDAYEGPDAWGVAPEGFESARLADYTLVNGEVVFIPSSRITKLAFRNRFTQGEKVTLEIASIHNPSAVPANQQAAAALRVYLADVAAASWVDLLRPDTRAGVQALATYGILNPARVDAILDNPILPEERPM